MKIIHSMQFSMSNISDRSLKCIKMAWVFCVGLTLVIFLSAFSEDCPYLNSMLIRGELSSCNASTLSTSILYECDYDHIKVYRNGNLLSGEMPRAYGSDHYDERCQGTWADYYPKEVSGSALVSGVNQLTSHSEFLGKFSDNVYQMVVGEDYNWAYSYKNAFDNVDTGDGGLRSGFFFNVSVSCLEKDTTLRYKPWESPLTWEGCGVTSHLTSPLESTFVESDGNGVISWTDEISTPMPLTHTMACACTQPKCWHVWDVQTSNFLVTSCDDSIGWSFGLNPRRLTIYSSRVGRTYTVQ